jgi:hypothetical protein
VYQTASEFGNEAALLQCGICLSSSFFLSFFSDYQIKENAVDVYIKRACKLEMRSKFWYSKLKGTGQMED